LGIILLFLYVQFTWDKTYDLPAPPLKVSTDSAVIAKGRYLVNGPAHCMSCHMSGFDDLAAADGGKEMPLRGGIAFPLGPLGTLYPANLTPDPETGIGRFTDEQIFRMMRHSIRPNGMASASLLMPFNEMADDDLVAIVSYLRSQQPVKHAANDAQFTNLGKIVRVMTPTFRPVEDPQAPATAPQMAVTVERGAYLANSVCNCVGCHTPRDPQTFEATGAAFSGGMEFEPWVALHKFLDVDTTLWMRTPNITPDPGGVLVNFKTPEEFVARFRQGRIISYSPMDWGPFSRMSDEDIRAIYTYLNSLPPVKHDVGELVFKK
jgi:mono/diheme cytochrome c family protein